MNHSRKGSVLVADDHGLYRKGLSFLIRDGLGYDDVIEASTFDSALDQMASADNIDLALFDLSMPGVGGPDSLSVVKEAYPNTRIVIVTATEHRETVLTAVATGLNGYLLKSMDDIGILKALESILEGRIYVPEFMATRSSMPAVAPGACVTAEETERATERSNSMSPRQKEVLQCVRRGLSNKEIARELDIAEGTVKIHLAALFVQFGVRNRTELATRI